MSGSKSLSKMSSDNTTLFLYKNVRQETWEGMTKTEKESLKTLEVKMINIQKIEHAVYNPSKLYIWYIKSPKLMGRLDIEFQMISEAKKALKRIRYIIKYENRERQSMSFIDNNYLIN